jgi:hypothetical protein
MISRTFVTWPASGGFPLTQDAWPYTVARFALPSVRIGWIETDDSGFIAFAICSKAALPWTAGAPGATKTASSV